MTYDFRAWLNFQPDNKPYNFKDCTGRCAIGQYMASRGEKWDMQRYIEHIKENFTVETSSALPASKTFGELKRALEPV